MSFPFLGINIEDILSKNEADKKKSQLRQENLRKKRKTQAEEELYEQHIPYEKYYFSYYNIF